MASLNGIEIAGEFLNSSCESPTYIMGDLVYSCGLSLSMELLKEAPDSHIRLINNVHNRHHENNHNPTQIWNLVGTHEETDDSYKITIACDCDYDNSH